MTVFLLDENVLRELAPTGSPNVRRWIAGVDDSDLRLSVVTLFEKRLGVQRLRRTDPARAQALGQALDAAEAAYRGRIVPIDAQVALAATARVHGFVLATRNVADFRGCDVDVLDPFRPRPAILRV